MINLINEAKSIGIISHVSTDGDAVGSSLGLYNSLKLLGKEDLVLIKNSDIPSHLQFIPGIEFYSEEEPRELDLIILLDLNEFYRTGNIGMEWIKKAKEVACIDHHYSEGQSFDFSYIDKGASSTSQLVSQFIRENNLPINKDIATSLYTGITTDTNRYMYNNSRKDAMRESIYLIENGAEVDKIYKHIFNSRKINEFKLANEVFEEGKFFYKDQGIILYLPIDLVEKYDLELDEVSFIKSMIMEFDQIKIAAIINEKEDGYKVSLRSKIDVNMAHIASKFGGGGHIRAAGFAIKKDNINIVRKNIKKRIEEEIYK